MASQPVVMAAALARSAMTKLKESQCSLVRSCESHIVAGACQTWKHLGAGLFDCALRRQAENSIWPEGFTRRPHEDRHTWC